MPKKHLFYELLNHPMRQSYEWSDQTCEFCWGTQEKILHIRRQYRNRDDFCGMEYLFSNFKVTLDGKGEECLDLSYVKESYYKSGVIIASSHH